MDEVICPECGHAIDRVEMDRQRFFQSVRKTEDCWLWEGAHTNFGYGVIGWHAKSASAHRVGWELHFGPIPKGLMVLHRCDRPACVRPEHLFLGTSKDNALDKMAKGRHRYHVFQGEDHGRAKVTNEEVRAIRRLYAEGISGPELSRRYGLGKTSTYRIIRRQSWRHLD